jgi:hypothetical protein
MFLLHSFCCSIFCMAFATPTYHWTLQHSHGSCGAFVVLEELVPVRGLMITHCISLCSCTYTPCFMQIPHPYSYIIRLVSLQSKLGIDPLSQISMASTLYWKTTCSRYFSTSCLSRQGSTPGLASATWQTSVLRCWASLARSISGSSLRTIL